MIFIVSNLVQLVYILKPKISNLQIHRHVRNKFLRSKTAESEKHNTVKDISVTAVFIDILRLLSASSSFSIHLST